MHSTVEVFKTAPEMTAYLNGLRQSLADRRDRRADVVARVLANLARRVAELGNGGLLRPSDLAQDGYVALFVERPEASAWRDREHFLAATSATMRHILIDHVRRRRHRGEEAEPTDALLERLGLRDDEPARIDEVVERLRQECPNAATILDLHVFGGVSLAAIASATNLSRDTVSDLFQYARARIAQWLRRDLFRDG